MNQKSTVDHSQTLPNQSTLLVHMGNAENALCTALHHVRNYKTIADIQRAMSRAMCAATLLKQTCDTVNVLKGGAA